MIKQERSLILNPGESKSADFILTVPASWKDTVPYTLSLVEQ